MVADRILGTFKFGRQSYIESFAKGLLYMNTLEHYVSLEGDAARNDPHEGVAYMLQGRGALFQIQNDDGVYQTIATVAGPIRSISDRDRATNVFCMYALRASAPMVDSQNIGFGDAYAVVLHHDEFMRRVKVAVSKIGHQLAYELVEYVDEASYEGPMGVFKKISSFAHQSEFRIALLPGKGKPYTLDVGDLSDIVKVGPLQELNQRIHLRAECDATIGAADR
jgi:hypothetical protein